MILEKTKFHPTVLVVDDDQNIISAFQDFLKREQCLMVSSASAEEALQKVHLEDIDLLIADVHLPNRSGVSMFLDMISAHPDIPVIVITGDPSSINETEARALGARYLLLKPLDIEKLRKAVRSCLSSHNVEH